MSTASISITGQKFSEEDEKRELDELPEVEKEAILNDVYGGHKNNIIDNNNNIPEEEDEENNGGDDNVGEEENGNNNEEEEQVGNNDSRHEEENDEEDDEDEDDVSADLLREFVSALEQIPTDERREQETAFTVISQDMLETESNPIRFLRCENYNPQRAALRLVEYWKARVEIFGEHAYEPLTLQGAMKHVISDMTLVPTWIRILPNDDHGRTVLFFDKTNILFKDYDYMLFIKMTWFGIHIALQRRSTQINGIVSVINFRSSGWDFPSRKLIKLLERSFNECLPIMFRCRHPCTSSLILKFCLPIFKSFMPDDMRRRIVVHNSKENPTILNELERYGLHRENLPKCIGGNYDEQPTWIIECKRMLKEQRKKKNVWGSMN